MEIFYTPRGHIGFFWEGNEGIDVKQYRKTALINELKINKNEKIRKAINKELALNYKNIPQKYNYNI